MDRQLIVLGTASQVPTRDRNHNGYVIRWGDVSVLFDPGEGTQRQMVMAGVRSTVITHICITHQHGDHTLGLPGVLQRMVLDQRQTPVTLCHPLEATSYVNALLEIADVSNSLDIRRCPLPTDSVSTIDLGRGSTLRSVPLDHRVPTLGYRIQEAPQTRMLPERLIDEGLEGPAVGELRRMGQITIDGRRVELEDVSAMQPGQAVAFVMDTRECAAITELVEGCDLAVMESTYREQDADLATAYGHLTSAQAARIAGAAGVRRLVLTHFSQRYPDLDGFLVEAAAHHGDVAVARDFDIVDVPRRRQVAVELAGG